MYCMVEFITGFSVGIELAEDEEINYCLIDLGIIRFNINWDK